eukprot:TRINITY_DN73968_c0_g1_i2.p2 TRINITY_DN73968_c0_g1~~TRINITY_DN73968_c0_g1_i2.p2  ORF type:complete len:119 (-),score=8.28 TRINITY_DN73968_c0_g1_i2:277-633(-)
MKEQLCKFSFQFDETEIHYLIVDLGKTIYVWIGIDGNMKNLNLSMPFIKEGNECPVTNLFGNAGDSYGSRLAQKISKRLGKAVFCSVNLLSGYEEMPLMVRIEEQMWKNITQHTQNGG